METKQSGYSMAVRVATVVAALAAFNVSGAEYDLSAGGPQSVLVDGEFGGVAIIADHWQQPTGTGVFDPFLTLDANGQTSTGNNNIEQAYNADGHNQLYLDGHRPSWNTSLRVGDLASVTINNVNYFAFILDANEPGNNPGKLISVDNIRIYTSASDNTANVADDISQLENLGTLRWAMNQPLVAGTTPPDLNGFNVNQWVKLDASQENVGHGNANGGSGQADMVVYIPQADFAGALATDYVWFYNLNGVHYSVEPGTDAAAGFEEWSAVVGPQQQVPDGGSTLALLGLGLSALGFTAGWRRKLA